jgi:putative sigma-54 modulation protein
MFMLSIYKKELNSMNFIISGKNIEVTPGLKEAIEQKLGKLERYFTPETEIIVTLSVEKERQKIEVTIPVKGNIIRSEQTSDDMYVSVDLVEEVIERQLRKYKNKLVARSQGHPTASGSGNNFKKEFFESEDDTSVDDEIRIVRTKRFGIKPMYPEDACIQMDLLGHAFFVFCNAETDEVNVVYKRKDGSFGLIEPEFS